MRKLATSRDPKISLFFLESNSEPEGRERE